MYVKEIVYGEFYIQIYREKNDFGKAGGLKDSSGWNRRTKLW